ncbi:MAG: MmcQ/YjbR family DNA-binding protein [Hyphomicrobiaceae bacterium]|nr:MmcQ/YjbR family DNA-binding protein [Hyphomicrobiaceae bacterium]
MAKKFPGATVVAAGDAIDVRVANKTFVALPANNANCAIFRLTLEQQEMLIAAEPEIFRRLDQYLGTKGWTEARLERLDDNTAISALRLAWANLAPKRMIAQFEL